MTPEQERVFFEMHSGIVEANAKLDALTQRMAEHEQADEAAYKRIGALEKSWVRLGAYYASACVVVPVVIWLLRQ